ncbi:MAG: hypothetical protein SPF89_04615 [Sphaerochaetaceae bacterium]|nr:hypothetical protein [Spirochaetales bacterium]MDY5499368.1 hypothetical protein [Sphaerochaetaceae bacterium]
MAGRVSAFVRRWLPLVVLLCLAFLAVGCKVLDGTAIHPSWVSHPISRQGVTAFVGHGSDSNSFNARLEALSDILSQLSESLGEDVSASGWRTFSTTDKLPDYDLSVVREFESGSDIWLMAEASTSAIESRRTNLQKVKLQQDALVKEMMEDVDAAYRDNRDGVAISTLLDAIYACATQPSSYDTQSLVRLAVSYMNAIRISLSKRDPRGPRVVVKVRRRQIMFNPKVVDTSIRATFDATDVWGNPRTDSLLFGSGERGQFQFVPYSVAISDKGSIVFSLDVADKLERLRQVLDAGLYASLEAAYQSSQVSFPYDRVSKYSGSAMLVGVVNAGPFDKDRVEASLSSWLLGKGVGSTVVELGGEMDEEALRLIHQKNPGATYLLAMEIREEGRTDIADIPLWIVTGNIQLWNLQSQSLVDQSGEMTLVEESLEDAYQQVLQVVTDRFSEYL